jgi:hypothetical protein
MIMMPYGWTLAIAAAHRSGGLLAPHRTPQRGLSDGGDLTSVSCPTTPTTPTFCAAVNSAGSAFTLNSNGTWTPASIDPGGGGLTAVSCPSDGFCAAVDQSGHVVERT